MHQKLMTGKTSKLPYTTDGKVKQYTKKEQIDEKLGRIIGKRYLEYRRQWDAANRFELVTNFPLFLHIDLNQKCNLRCPHCIVGHPDLLAKYYSDSSLPWSNYAQVIDEGQEHNCPSLSVQGDNEPLLIKDLEKYIEYAHRRGFIDIMMNTNATPLTERRAKRLLNSGLTRFRFSLDASTPETYSKVRVGGNYEKVIRNIDRFLDLKAAGGYELPLTGVNLVKMKYNEHEIDDFFRIWEDKVDIVTIQTFVPPALERDFSHMYSSDQRVREDSSPMEFKCVQPFQRVVIRNYDITPCCTMFSSRLKIGDLRTDTIYKAWNSEKMTAIREMHAAGEYFKDPVCKKCVDLIYPTRST